MVSAAEQEEQYLLKNYQSEKYGAAKSTSYDRFRPLNSHQRSVHRICQHTHNNIGFSRVFSYTSYLDRFLIVIGCISAVIHGTGIPFLAYTFGEMTNNFLEAQNEYPFTEKGDFPSLSTNTSWSSDSNETGNSTSVPPDVTEVTLTTHLQEMINSTSKLLVHPTDGKSNFFENLLPTVQQDKRNSMLKARRSLDKIRTNDMLLPIISTSPSSEISEESTNKINKILPLVVTEQPEQMLTSDKKEQFIFTTPLIATKIVLTNLTNKPNTSFHEQQAHKFRKKIENSVMNYAYLGLTVIVAAYLQALCWQLSCEQQMFLLHQDFFYQVLRQDSAWFSCHQSKSIILNLIDDLSCIHDGIGLRLGSFVQYISTLITSLAIGFSVQWQLTAVAFSLTPFMVIVLGLIGKYLDAFIHHEEEALNLSSKQVNETLSCIRTVASYMGQHFEGKRYNDLLEIVKTSASKKHFLHSFSLGIVFFVLYCTNALLCWYGVYLKNEGVLPNIGNIFIVAFCIMMAFFSLGHIIPCFQAIMAADSASAHIFSIVNKIPKIDPYLLTGCHPIATKGTLKFSNVSFTRPNPDLSTKSKLEMLRHLTLTLKAGQTIALVGSDDCGKDLLKELLFRFYDPVEGQLYLDGHDLRSLNVHWLRNIVCYIEKDPVFFERMVVENITAELHYIAFEEVMEAAKNLHAHDFILSLPEGYATVIGEKEVTLSVEIKQLIALVRSSLRNPQIVILEESTEVIDRESLDAFNKALEIFQKQRTVLILAKRLSTVKKADHVVVLQDGWVVAQGTYQELSTQDVLCHYLLKNNILLDDVNGEEGESVATDVKKFRSNIHKRRPSPWIPLETLKDIGSQNDKSKYFSRILRLCKEDWLFIFFGCVSAVVFGMTSPAAAYLFAELFYIFYDHFQHSEIAGFDVSIGFVFLATIAGISYMLRTAFFLITGERMIQRLRQMAFQKILHQPLRWLEEEQHNAQNLATILADKTLTKALEGGFGTFVSTTVCLIAGIVMGMIYGWQLASVIVGAMTLLLIVGILLIRLTFSKQSSYNHHMNEASQIVYEAVQKLWLIQSLTMERKILEAYIDKLTVPYFLSKKQAQIFAIVFALAQGMIYFVYALIFLLGLHLILNNMNSPNEVIRVFFAVAVCVISLVQLLKQWHIYEEISNAAASIFHLIDLPGGENSLQKDGLRPEIRGSVTLQGIYFRHASRMNIPLLQGLDLAIKHGQLVAVIGGGSRSILDLVNRLYEPIVGQIMVDSFGVHQLTLSHLRNNVAFIGDPLIVSGTLYENIIYGADDSMLNSSRMDVAIKQSGITDFVWDLPQGWKTVLGESGTTLRRKDQIRIALARVCLRDPRILLVEDIFKTVIPEDMPLVLKSFRNVSRGRTCIITTTAPSILRSADWIVVLEKGVISEEGKHDELFSKRGSYYNLYHQNTL